MRTAETVSQPHDHGDAGEQQNTKTNWFQQNELSLVITAITMIAPSLFEFVSMMEKYHPRTALRIQLGRLLLLYIDKVDNLDFESGL